MYLNRDFPQVSNSNRFSEPLQATGFTRVDQNGFEEVYTGSLSYLEFIGLVKKLWEESYPIIPILPRGVNKESYQTSFDTNTTADGLDQTSSVPNVSGLDEFPAIIGYSLELRKARTDEPKPRMRQHVLDNSFTIYGQKFQNIVSFTIMSKVGTFEGPDSTSTRDDLDAAVLVDQVAEAFEDFMLEYTPIFKAAGASELVYSRRLSDSEMARQVKDLHQRSITYMLTTEKTFAVRNETLKKINIDVRTWMAMEKEILSSLATPNYEDVTINIIDLDQTSP